MYPTQSDLRLQIEQTPTTGYVNLVPNSTGELGGWGWKTDHPNSSLSRSPLTTLAATQLRFVKTTSTGRAFLYTDQIPVVASRFIRASFQFANNPSGSGLNIALDWYGQDGKRNGVGSIVSTTAASGTLATDTTTVPSTAASARLTISTQDGTPLPALEIANVRLYVRTSNDLSLPLPAPAASAWVDVLGPTTDIRIVREEFGASTLTATILDPTLDPATSTLLRPGRSVRLQVLQSGTWQTLYRGRIPTSGTTYDLRRRASKQVEITVNCEDAAAVLANTAAPTGVRTVTELPHVLEGGLVPWNINGSTAQVPTPTTVTRNADASALDQIVITRDSQRGYAWVSREGVVNVWDAASLSNIPVLALTESAYLLDGLDLDWSLDRVINEVTVKQLRANAATGETVEVAFGPYRDEASIREWGRRAADYTVNLLAADVPAWASAVLAANAQPARRINSVRVAITEAANLPRALLDMYSMVTVANSGLGGLTQQARVTGIEHEISAEGSWVVTYRFSQPGTAAAPRSVSVGTGTPTSNATEPDGAAPHAERSRTNTQNLPHNTTTTVLWTQTFVEERGGLTYAAGVWSVPRAGRYLVAGTVAMSGNATGVREARVVRAGSSASVVQARIPAGTAAEVFVNFTAVMQCAEGDTLSVAAFQNSGGALTVNTGSSVTITGLD